MQVLENDLAFLRASAPVLEDYLLSDVLYYPITGEHGHTFTGDSTRLTLGNLLLSEKRARAVETESSADLAGVVNQIAAARGQWLSLWKIKIAKEIPNRLMLWKNYLNDLGDEPGGQVGDYPYNVRLRVILDLLLAESDGLWVGEKAMIQALDHKLKAKGSSGPFVWDHRLENSFPADPFWYLYWQFLS